MTTLSQRLAALHQERGNAVTSYETILQPCLTENRDLNETERVAVDNLRQAIDGIDQQIERLSEAETLIARSAAPILEAVPGDRPGTFVTLQTERPRPVIQMQRRDAYKGADFTRMAIAVCRAGHWNAAAYAQQRWGDEELSTIIRHALWIQRAQTPPLSSGEAVGGALGGASLVRLEHLGDEFIEMLRPMLIVGRLPSMRRLQFNNAGTLLLPRQTGGVAGGYIGEGGNIRVQRPTFGQLQLVPSKLAVIVPTTVELLDRSDPGLEQIIRDDMLEGTARTIDNVFFSTAALAAAPPGILNAVPINLGGAIAAGATVNAVTDALKAMILALRMANVPMTAPVWIMNARTKESLRLLRTTQEIFAFKSELDAGTLLGYPVIDSTSIPIPFPPGLLLNTAYALIDASQLIWAEDRLPIIDASEHASIISDDAPPAAGTPPGAGTYFSAFQNDMVFMRIRMRHTWARRHDVAVTWALTEE
jgi:HK97 family phage major capsid protein